MDTLIVPPGYDYLKEVGVYEDGTKIYVPVKAAWRYFAEREGK